MSAEAEPRNHGVLLKVTRTEYQDLERAARYWKLPVHELGHLYLLAGLQCEREPGGPLCTR